MIQMQTILKVVDNSGAKTVRCFKVIGGFKKKSAKLGDTIMVSVQKTRNKNRKMTQIKKGEVFRALVISTKIGYLKKDGSRLLLSENAVILLNKQENPIGTRILGPVPKFLNKKKFQKMIMTSSGSI